MTTDGVTAAQASRFIKELVGHKPPPSRLHQVVFAPLWLLQAISSAIPGLVI